MPLRVRWTRLRELTCLEDRIVPAIVFEMEPNESISTANSITLNSGDILATAPGDWTIVQGGIATGADRDYFRITLATKSAVFFDLDSRDTGLSTTLDAVLDVFDSTGFTLIDQSDDGYDFEGFKVPVAEASSATSPDPSLYLQLNAGSYLVRLTSFASSSTGTYQLRMLADSNSTTVVPTFASLPGAPVTFSLDFDGQAGTDEWGTYNVAPFDLTGDTATFDPLERLAIRNLYRVVAEDFLPFNVNITTVNPGSLADGVGFRLVVTSSNSGSSLGLPANSRGAAQFGGFAGAGANTGFVFQPPFGDYVGGMSGQAMAASVEEGNAASQQIGTALGLRHYGGANPQPSGIMQFLDLGLNRATWSQGMTYIGEPPVINQDDVAIITSPTNGITLRPDDHGDTIATATLMTGALANGIIADRSSDKDMFRLPAGTSGLLAGWVRINAYTGNMDAQLRVYNSSGALLATGDSTGSFDASVDAFLASGDSYYVEVRSSGAAGAIGSYSVDFSANPAPGPVQVVTASVNGGAAQRSMVTELFVRFNQPLTFPNGSAAAFRVAPLIGPDIPIDLDFSASTQSQTSVRVRFPNGSGGFTTLSDGAYSLTIVSSNVLDPALQNLDGDANGLGGDNFVMPFHRLYGDMDGDHTVTQADFVPFRNTFTLLAGDPSFNGLLDGDGNGVIDQQDFILFRSNFGVIV